MSFFRFKMSFLYFLKFLLLKSIFFAQMLEENSLLWWFLTLLFYDPLMSSVTWISLIEWYIYRDRRFCYFGLIYTPLKRHILKGLLWFGWTFIQQRFLVFCVFLFLFGIKFNCRETREYWCMISKIFHKSSGMGNCLWLWFYLVTWPMQNLKIHIFSIGIILITHGFYLAYIFDSKFFKPLQSSF